MVTTASLEIATASIKNPGQTQSPLPKAESKSFPTLYVFRHGETFYNRRRLFCGQHNSYLTPQGKKQSQALAKKLQAKKIDLGITPDLTRCTMTLQLALANYHPGVEVKIEKRLRERDYGKLTHQSKIAWAKRHPELTLKYRRSWDFPPPGGESLKDVWVKRIRPFCEDIEKQMRREKINVAVSCTNNTMRLIRMYFEKLTIPEMLSLENPLGEDYAAYTIR